MRSFYILILVLFNITLLAQNQHHIGIRTSTGLSYKFFLKDKHSVEYSVGSRLSNGMSNEVIYMYNYKIKRTNLYLYGGGGIILNFYDADLGKKGFKLGLIYGMSGMFGLEYRFKKIPISLGYDYQITFANSLIPVFSSINIRYIIRQF